MIYVYVYLMALLSVLMSPPPSPLSGHNASLAILGVFILWFGWYGFNPGSALMIVGAEGIVQQAAITTTLSACAAALSTMCTGKMIIVVLLMIIRSIIS